MNMVFFMASSRVMVAKAAPLLVFFRLLIIEWE